MGSIQLVSCFISMCLVSRFACQPLEVGEHVQPSPYLCTESVLICIELLPRLLDSLLVRTEPLILSA